MVSIDTIYNNLKGKMSSSLSEASATAVENFLLAMLDLLSQMVPIMTTRAVEVLPTMVHSLFFECTCAACVVLLVVNYPLFRWLSTLVHSAVCSYVIPLVVYATTCILSKVMADYATYPSEEIDVLVGYVI